MLNGQECRNCDHYRWIARRCTLDRDEIYESGYLCKHWEPVQIRKAPTNDQ